MSAGRLGWLNAFAWEHAVARAAVSFSFAKSTSSHRRDGWGACNTEEIVVRIPHSPLTLDWTAFLASVWVWVHSEDPQR